MTFARIPAQRLLPALPAARTNTPAVLWEARVSARGPWSWVMAKLSVLPVTTGPPWGGDVWVRNDTTGAETVKVHCTTARPHVLIVGELASSEGDLIIVLAEPSDEAAAIWVDDWVLTVSTEPLPATGSPSDPDYQPPAPGFDEARFDIDPFS